MSNYWKPINQLREIYTEISGWDYSLKYAEEHDLTQKCRRRSFGDNPSMWIPEPIEVTIGRNSEILYRLKKSVKWYKNPKEKFKTSLGDFICHNRGEFGGELITPKGILLGNFEEIFECNNITYAIDSCNHLGVGHLNIYAFSKSLKPKQLYSSQKHKGDKIANWISFKGLFLSDTYAYVLASGSVNYDLFSNGNKWDEKSYLFKLRNGKLAEQIEFDFTLSYVENIVVRDNKLIVGMDKIVSIIDLYTKEIKSYTPISIEAEQDIIQTKGD